eukprot:TRINITY_DN3025_c0_g1_i2.p1 TRINITY_DN3025_c0_g1~~TRINITY_DN3025_c0_g1_i2.p1  ORF type:complete len:343 (+),score=65.38 TRINITY_DN3025_c0_g1_i2:359-1387(+)
MGSTIFYDVVKPMLDVSKVPYDYIFTTHQDHAFEIGKNIDTDLYSVVASISGDGMLGNIMNGIFHGCRCNRQLFKEKINKLALAIIPAGTSNGLAESLGWSDPFKAAKGLIENEPKYIDVMEIASTAKLPGAYDVGGSGGLHDDNSDPVAVRWDLHTLNWALTADVDFLLEHQTRWLPRILRDIFIPIYVILLNRCYHPKLLSFLPVFISEEERKSKFYSDPEDLPMDRHREGWRVWDKPVKICMAANTNIQATDLLLTPFALLNEGSFDLLLVEDSNPLIMVKMFLSREVGIHLKLGYANAYKCKKMILQVSNGVVDTSGELLDAKSMEVTAHADVVRFIY